jgi:phospholipid N-methyltransferase
MGAAVSEFIQDFRVKNPQYDDLADDQLVTALHSKYYSDIPIEQFNQKIGYQSVSSDIEQQSISQEQEVPPGAIQDIDDGYDGPVAQAYEPTLWGQIKSLGDTDSKKARAMNEFAAQQLAKEQGKPVEQVYQEAGFQRPLLNPEGRPAVRALSEGTEIVAKQIPEIPQGVVNSLLRVVRGGDETAEDNFIDDAIKWTEPAKPEYIDKNYQNMFGIGKSLGTSLAVLASTITAGALAGETVVGAPIAGAAAGASTAYRASKDEFLDRIKTDLDKKSEQINGRPLNQEEWSKAYSEHEEAAKEWGRWEAIPEALSNMIFLRALAGPMKGLGKKALQDRAKKAAQAVGTEQVTETITGVGQSGVEADVGIGEQKTVGEAFREQVVQTAIVTGLMGGGAAGGKYAYEAAEQQLSPERAIAKEMESQLRTANPELTEIELAERFASPLAQEIYDIKRKTPEQKTVGEMVKEKIYDRGIELKSSLKTDSIKSPKEEITPEITQQKEDIVDKADIVDERTPVAELTDKEIRVEIDSLVNSAAQKMKLLKKSGVAQVLPDESHYSPDDYSRLQELTREGNDRVKDNGDLADEDYTEGEIEGLETFETPVNEITVSKDVPQFKEGANVEGVVDALGGKFDRVGVAPIQIWVRENGSKEVISGRHRLDLAKRSGEKTIPAQYHYESDGFGTDQASALDAILNIREGQGKVKDYVEFIKATKPRKQEAEAQGILARQTGRRAFAIATTGSDALITAHKNDQITDEGAARIAEASPKNEKLQAVGIKAIQEGKTIAVAENLVKAVKSMTDETQQASGDLFDFDDSAMIEAEKLAKAASKKQSEIQKTLSAVQGAAKRPDLAKKEGIDVKDPEGIKNRIKELKDQKRKWSNWHTNSKLVSELKGKKLEAVNLPKKAEISQKEQKSEQKPPKVATKAEKVQQKAIPERIAFGPTSFKTKPIKGRLYRETNIEGISSLLRESLSNTKERGAVTSLFVTDDPQLALGQGKNQGVKIEFDGDLVSGQVNKKPGTGIMGGNEYKTDYINRDAIETFTIPKGVRLKGISNTFARRQFNKVDNADGTTTYTRKDLPKKAEISQKEEKSEPKTSKTVKKPEIVNQKEESFTNYNAVNDKGEPVKQTFTKGDFAKGIKSDKDKTFFDGGEIEGISQAKKQAKINGVWHDFGSIVKAEKPKEIKTTKKTSEVIESVSKTKGKDLTEADKVPGAYTIKSYSDFRETVANQTATAKDILADAENVIANKDKIITELSDRKFTKAMLQQIIKSPRNDLKKPQMVKQAYQQMLSEHVMADATFTMFGGSKTFEEQIIEQIRNQTQADVDQAYEKQREYRAQMEQRKEKFVKALTNPETLPEFKEFIRVRGKEKMTAEQLAAYDELVSGSLAKEDKPTVVPGEVETIKTERAQTKHTKTGNDLFVVKMVGRVPKEKFRELSAKAKQFGGYYSSYSKGEAIPGFQFKTVEAADQFEQLLSGKDIDKSDFNEAKAEVKQAKNADKLLEMAEKMENKANEAINQPRQANTARRASMAASATETAEKQLALAKTVRNIAIRLQEGDLTHLSKLNQVTQLEELISVQKRAIPNNLYESESYDGYSINRTLKEGVTVEDYIAKVKMPGSELRKEGAAKAGQVLKGVRGYAKLAAQLRKLGIGNPDEYVNVSDEMGTQIRKAVKQGKLDKYDIGWYFVDQAQTVSRLNRLGITTVEQLRAAIRELDSLRVAKRKADPIKALERDLIGKKIEGYFPTPKELVDQMIDIADIKAGHEVLEPSAGKGNIAQEIQQAAPDAILEVVEYNAGLRAILEAKGFEVVGNDFLEVTKNYDRIVMNPPFENYQDIEHVQHAFSLLKPGGKLVAIMGAGVKNSRKKAVEFRGWLDDAGSYIEDLPAGSFKSSDRPTGVATVMVTIEKNDSNTLARKKDDSNYKIKDTKPVEPGEQIFNAPGSNFIGLFRSTGIPERREFIYIDGRKVKIPEKPQRTEPIIAKLVKIMGRRIYHGKIKGKSSEGFYRPSVGEVRTRKKNDIEVLAHEMAHYLDHYSNITLPNFKKFYKDPRYSDEIKALSYTDADNMVMEIEGFAEFVRLWLTNSQEAFARAPNFYRKFIYLFQRDRKLANHMRDAQELMHKFYFQGPDKLGQALIGKNLSFKHRFDEWLYRRDSLFRQQVIDRFHAARKIEQELTGKIGNVQESAWKQLRIANGGSESISYYIMNFGTVNFDENGDLQKTGKSLHEVLEPVKSIKIKPEHKGSQKIDLLLRYLAGRRALELHRQGRENLIPIETAKEWARYGRAYPIFESIQRNYQAFNGRMMDFYEEAGLITPEGRKIIEEMNKDYVPFNRIREQLAGGRIGAGGGFQKLVGGTANVKDILVNIQDGITANTRSALTNRAKQRLYQYISGHKDGSFFAVKLGADSEPVEVHLDEMKRKISKIFELNGIELDGELEIGGKDLLTFWQHGIKPKLGESGNIVDTVTIDGKPVYYEVQDPLLQGMLLSMNPESYGSFMNVMFGVKNLFTRTITLGAEFMGANLVRDTGGAAFLSKNNFTPFIDSFKGMYSFITKDKNYQDFMKAGAGYSSRIDSITREGAARKKVRVDEFGVLTMPEKLLSTIDNIASAFEYGTRIGDFMLAKKNGKSDMDAGFEGSEISTNFSVTGSNRFLSGYIRTVPFLNAMIQSQDRVFREAFIGKKYDGNPTGMAMKAFLGITVPTLILYLINKDDEDYKAIPDYEKRTNWHIKVGDNQYVKIPRPYDVGFVYATMPELFAKYAEDDKGKEFAEGMIWTLTQMYGIDGTPAMMTGWWDLVRNEKWTGAPVVPKSLSDVEAPEQYTSNTAETFVRMGEALGVSPVKAEHMFKAYTGYLGGYLLWGTDHMLWDEEKFGEKPDSKTSDNIFLRRFLTSDVRPATAAMEKFFDLKEKSDKIVSTFKQQIDVRRAIKGQLKPGQKFKGDRFFGLTGKEKEVLFALNDSMNQLIKVMYGKEGIKTAEIKVKHNKKLSGKRKREELDKLWNSRNDAFMKYYLQADQAMQKAKQQSQKFNQEKK